MHLKIDPDVHHTDTTMHVHKQGNKNAYFHTTIFTKTYYYDANRRNVSVRCLLLDKHTTCFITQLNILDITTRCELMDYESCPGRERIWEVRGCPAQPQPDLTFSAALPGFNALSSADSGWRMSWMDFCPEEASDRGAPALIALIGSDRAGVLISQRHDPRQQTSVRSGSRFVS